MTRVWLSRAETGPGIALFFGMFRTIGIRKYESMSYGLPLSRPVLEALHFVALGKGFLRYRNPRRRRAGGNRKAFNEQAWREAAVNLGASWRPLGSGFCEIVLGDVRTRVFDNVSAIDDPVMLGILHDKPLTHRILREAGLPVPPHATFTLKDVGPAAEFLRSADGVDCVVKPAAGTGGGAGVATGIRTRWQLARAAAAAAVYSDQLMIERQVEGDNYRLLYLDGQLLDAYVRKFPAVIADGKSTVRTLVRRANEERLAQGSGISQALLTFDLDMRRTLAKQGYTLRSIPPAGTSVRVKTAVNENAGADNTTATGLLCPAVIEEGSRAATALGARFVGVDIVTPDPVRPLAEAGGVILEVNGTPNLYFHYHKQDASFPAALHALRRLLGITRPNDHTHVDPDVRLPEEASRVR